MIGDVASSLERDRGGKDQDGRHEQGECDEVRVIYVRALMRGLDAAFVPFALLKHDPLVMVRDHVAEHGLELYGQSKNSVTAQERVLAELVSMRNAWNSVFRELRIDQMFFLCAWNSVPGASLHTVRATGLSLMIATPCVRRWLVTRPMWWHDELVAWCVVIDTEALPRDGVAEVVLSEQNMLRLRLADFLMEPRIEGGQPSVF